MIYDLRFTIAGGRARGVKNLCQLFGFAFEGVEFGGGKQTREFGQFNPETCFVRLFKDDGDLVDEVSPRFAAQRSALIGRHGSAAARNLVRNRPPRRLVRQGVCKLQNTDSKLHGALFEFDGCHKTVNLPTGAQSSIVNHQS
jgi:hypothetical protein